MEASPFNCSVLKSRLISPLKASGEFFALQFACPSYSVAVTRLRFGDHDRLADPTDCSKFYACLLSGQPRVATCPPPLAFDQESGFCTDYRKVKGCEHIYDHLGSKPDVIFKPVVVDAPVVDSAIRSVAGGVKRNFYNFEQRF